MPDITFMNPAILATVGWLVTTAGSVAMAIGWRRSHTLEWRHRALTAEREIARLRRNQQLTASMSLREIRRELSQPTMQFPKIPPQPLPPPPELLPHHIVPPPGTIAPQKEWLAEPARRYPRVQRGDNRPTDVIRRIDDDTAAIPRTDG